MTWSDIALEIEAALGQDGGNTGEGFCLVK